MFSLKWTALASETYADLRVKAENSLANRSAKKKKKSPKAEGLFKQVQKTLKLLREDTRHPGLHTHEFDSLDHPYKKGEKVFEAYAQNKTPGAYRVFWCYGPNQQEITIIAITTHP